MCPKNSPERAIRLPILPVGFVLLAISISVLPATGLASEASTICSSKHAIETDVIETQNSPSALNSQSQYRYSPSMPLANTYPSVRLCANSFAVRIANNIRENNQFTPQTKFSIELGTEIQTTDGTDWQPAEKFITDFKNALEDQFPVGTFVIATKDSKQSDSDANAPNLQTLAIHFSHIACKDTNTKNESTLAHETDPSESIRANWAIGNTAPSEMTINYVTKPWIATDRDWSNHDLKSFGCYRSGHYKSRVIGFTNQLASSPQEASSLAMQNATHFNSLHYGSGFSLDDFKFKVIDRFQQKLSTTNGDYWQAAVLVAVSQKNESLKKPAPLAQVNSAKLLVLLIAGTFGAIWISSLLFKAIF